MAKMLLEPVRERFGLRHPPQFVQHGRLSNCVEARSSFSVRCFCERFGKKRVGCRYPRQRTLDIQHGMEVHSPAD
jgi:hypothetical protein